MNQYFNIFGQAETPELILCNPNKEELFSLPLAYEIKNTLRFNAISELDFKYPQSKDGGVTTDPVYVEIQGKKLILVTGVGYYIINNAEIDDTGAVPIKNVNAKSLESELLHTRVTGFTGTFSFLEILQNVLSLSPNWTIGTIEPALLLLYRTFTPENSTVYNFIVEKMEKAFGCVFTFDTFARTVTAISNVIPTTNTNIYLSFDNLIKQTNFKEVTEEISTVLSCYGGGSLDIHYVNPLGTNKIYNFNYFKTWMSMELQDALTLWEAGVLAAQTDYANNLTVLSNLYFQQTKSSSDLVALNDALISMNNIRKVILQQDPPGDTTQIDIQIAAQYVAIASKSAEITNTQTSINNYKIVLRHTVHSLFFTSDMSFKNFSEDMYASGITINNIIAYWQNIYNSSSTYPGFDPVYLAAQLETIRTLIDNSKTANTALYDYVVSTVCPPSDTDQLAIENLITAELSVLGTLYALLQSIIPFTTITTDIDSIVAILTSYKDIIHYTYTMTYDQYLELTTYIYDNTYTNENIIITDLMTNEEIQAQSQVLYNQALDVIGKTAYPRYEFTGQFSNFVALQSYASFTAELDLGKSVNIKKDENTTIEAVLLELVFSYDNPSDFGMTLSNSFRLDNNAFIYSDLMMDRTGVGSSGTSTSGVTGSAGGSTTIVQNGLLDAPVDGSTYGRQDGSWVGIIPSSTIMVTTVGDPGLDTNLPTEQAVREAITAIPKNILIREVSDHLIPQIDDSNGFIYMSPFVDVNPWTITIDISKATGNDRLVMAFVSTKGIIVSCTLNSTPGTWLYTTSNDGIIPGNTTVAVYYWLDADLPATAGTYNLTTTTQSNVNYSFTGVNSLYNVNQTTPFGTPSECLNAEPLAVLADSGDLLIDFIGITTEATNTPNGGQTLLYSATGAFGFVGISSSHKTANAPSTPMGWGTSGLHLAVPIKTPPDNPDILSTLVVPDGSIVSSVAGVVEIQFPSAPLVDHDHSGTGEGGTFDAANLESGAASSGDVLTADGTGGTQWDAPSTPSLALDALTNVNVPSPSDNDVLTFDTGTGMWVGAPSGGTGATELSALTDVDIPSPNDGDVLTYDENTLTWISAAPTGGGGGGGLTTWAYRKQFTIAHTDDGALSNYNMKVTIHRSAGSDSGTDVYVETKCASDYRDIRFTNLEGVIMNHWVESSDSSAAVIWVQFDQIPAHPDDGVYYLVYGNALATTSSNGKKTFPVFDDFDGSTFDTTTWGLLDSTPTLSGSEATFTGGGNGVGRLYPWKASLNFYTVIRIRGKQPEAGYNFGIGSRMTEGSGNCYRYINNDSMDITHFKFLDDAVAWGDSYDSFIADTYYILESWCNPAQVLARVDDGTIRSWNRTGRYGPPCVSLPTASGKTAILSWALTRNISATEPTWGTWDTEETGTFTPTSLSVVRP
jgi:hypothetical protein